MKLTDEEATRLWEACNNWLQNEDGPLRHPTIGQVMEEIHIAHNGEYKRGDIWTKEIWVCCWCKQTVNVGPKSGSGFCLTRSQLGKNGDYALHECVKYIPKDVAKS